MSWRIFCHAYDLAMIAKVAFPYRWAKLWITSKTGRWRTAGTRTRGFPSDVSHTTGRSMPGKCTCSSLSEEAGSSPRGGWSKASFERLTSESVCAIEWTIAGSLSPYWRVNALAMTFSRPGTWVMSVANWLMKASWWRCRFDKGSQALKKVLVRGFWSVYILKRRPSRMCQNLRIVD